MIVFLSLGLTVSQAQLSHSSKNKTSIFWKIPRTEVFVVNFTFILINGWDTGLCAANREIWDGRKSGENGGRTDQLAERRSDSEKLCFEQGWIKQELLNGLLFLIFHNWLLIVVTPFSTEIVSYNPQKSTQIVRNQPRNSNLRRTLSRQSFRRARRNLIERADQCMLSFFSIL